MSNTWDIWNQWRNGLLADGETYGSSTDFSKRKVNRFNRTDLSTAGGEGHSGASADMDRRIPRKRGEVPINPKYVREKSQVRDRLGRIIEPGSQLPSADFQTRFTGNKKGQWMGPNEQVQKGLTESAAKTPFHPSQGGDSKFHTDAGDQQKWWNVLANKIGFDYETAKATWEKKGGFEGLMANPAFTMGLAFMSAGAEGKTLGQGALDNVIKAGGISQHYKKIMKDRTKGVIEATEGQMDDIKGVLGEMNISGPGWRKMLPGNQSASYEQAVEDISIKVQQKVDAMKAEADKSGKKIVVGKRLKKKIIQEMIDSGEINTKRVFFDKTLETKAEGGPVQAGKPYIVGEKGPEVIIPKSDGNVIANDDSQIFAMLLASNPQLQNVSRQRAERILRSRFPEYFE